MHTPADQSSHCLKLGLSHVCNACCSLFPWVTHRESATCSVWLGMFQAAPVRGVGTGTTALSQLHGSHLCHLNFPVWVLVVLLHELLHLLPKVVTLWHLWTEKGGWSCCQVMWRRGCPGSRTGSHFTSWTCGSGTGGARAQRASLCLRFQSHDYQGRQDTWACSVPRDSVHPLTFEMGQTTIRGLDLFPPLRCELQLLA